MKKTVNVAIGGCSFILDEDAYDILNDYLERSKAAIERTNGRKEVLEELEVKIADELKWKLGGKQVVDIAMAQKVIGQLGYPEGYEAPEEQEDEQSADPSENPQENAEQFEGDRPVRKLFRDPDGKKIAGVCSGLALFLGIDAVLIRILFLIALICGSAGFWIYVVIWITAPEAKTAAEKCELRGIPATAENIRRFTESH
ncbi:MAG: PspC domain-containing protein [Bacteroidales bacterium]|nr:PspC domain-containing protein [Bacteroidales bacterium]